MAKNDSLSSDINFIKEFEELKLKQKLLVESLKKKGKSEYEMILTNIDSKLDFLVKIFKEAKEVEAKHEEEGESTIASVMTSLDELKVSLDEKYSELFTRLTHLESSISSVDVCKPILTSNSELKPLENSMDDENKKIGSDSVSKPGELPAPDFKVDTSKPIVMPSSDLKKDISDKIDSVDKKDLPSEEKKKEKKVGLNKNVR